MALSTSTSCGGLPADAVVWSLNLVGIGLGTGYAGAYLSAWPTGQAWPGTSVLNFNAGAETSGFAVIQAGASGSIDLIANRDVDVVIDINGYYAPNSSALSLNPLQVALLKWYPANLSVSFAVGSSPVGIAFDGADIWVANYYSGTVQES